MGKLTSYTQYYLNVSQQMLFCNQKNNKNKTDSHIIFILSQGKGEKTELYQSFNGKSRKHCNFMLFVPHLFHLAK